MLQKGGVNYALLQIDRAVYQVRPGSASARTSASSPA